MDIDEVVQWTKDRRKLFQTTPPAFSIVFSPWNFLGKCSLSFSIILLSEVLTGLKACLTQGIVIGWAVFIGVILAIVFLGPPLWFEEDKTGYLYTGAFIGAIIGLVFAGLLTDSINKAMIRLNRGKYEPEFRILLVAFQLVFSAMGLYGFGWTASDVEKYHWLLPDVFFAFLIIGMVMGAVAASLYIVDAHRK